MDKLTDGEMARHIDRQINRLNDRKMDRHIDILKDICILTDI
jgi:hypothetical protein